MSSSPLVPLPPPATPAMQHAGPAMLISSFNARGCPEPGQVGGAAANILLRIERRGPIRGAPSSPSLR